MLSIFLLACHPPALRATSPYTGGGKGRSRNRRTPCAPCEGGEGQLAGEGVILKKGKGDRLRCWGSLKRNQAYWQGSYKKSGYYIIVN